MDKENITFENMSPFNYPEEIINHFKNMLGIDSNEGIQEFAKKDIGILKYSTHQINIVNYLNSSDLWSSDIYNNDEIFKVFMK